MQVTIEIEGGNAEVRVVVENRWLSDDPVSQLVEMSQLVDEAARRAKAAYEA